MSKMNQLIEYVESHRVPDSKIVYSKKGKKQSGFYTTSKSAEVASNVYMGMHRYQDKENRTTELWALGQLLMTFQEDK